MEAIANLQEKMAGVTTNTPSQSPSSHSAANLPLHADPPRAPTTIDKLLQFFTVREPGESGRRGIHPLQFLRIALRSSSRVSRVVNVLWPVVPAAIAVRWAMPDNHLVIFILSYLAMVPCANLLGFAGQELSRKVPHVMGVLVETT
jgi:Ca2+:H+ antiporter